MNIPSRECWTQEQSFSWAEGQAIRYEFDAVQPVAMTGGPAGHSRIVRNVDFALCERVRGGACEPLGPDASVETTGKAVRYPDALVTNSKLENEDRVVPGVVVVFEVLGPTSGRSDRIIKVREYAAVPCIRRYVILESTEISTGIGVSVMERSRPGGARRATALTGDDVLRVPEIGIEIPVAAFSGNMMFPEDDNASAG